MAERADLVAGVGPLFDWVARPARGTGVKDSRDIVWTSKCEAFSVALARFVLFRMRCAGLPSRAGFAQFFKIESSKVIESS
jgi:hypothetical protein